MELWQREDGSVDWDRWMVAHLRAEAASLGNLMPSIKAALFEGAAWIEKHLNECVKRDQGS